jgi:hypothetical protein
MERPGYGLDDVAFRERQDQDHNEQHEDQSTPPHGPASLG